MALNIKKLTILILSIKKLNMLTISTETLGIMTLSILTLRIIKHIKTNHNNAKHKTLGIAYSSKQ